MSRLIQMNVHRIEMSRVKEEFEKQNYTYFQDELDKEFQNIDVHIDIQTGPWFHDSFFYILVDHEQTRSLGHFLTPRPEWTEKWWKLLAYAVAHHKTKSSEGIWNHLVLVLNKRNDICDFIRSCNGHYWAKEFCSNPETFVYICDHILQCMKDKRTDREVRSGEPITSKETCQYMWKALKEYINLKTVTNVSLEWMLNEEARKYYEQMMNDPVYTFRERYLEAMLLEKVRRRDRIHAMLPSILTGVSRDVVEYIIKPLIAFD